VRYRRHRARPPSVVAVQRALRRPDIRFNTPLPRGGRIDIGA
jgi:hypothetical protein